MTDQRKDGGPAFPVETTATPYAPGMSLRDWFAGQALAGCGRQWYDNTNGDDATVSRFCYEAADAMLASREVLK